MKLFSINTKYKEGGTIPHDVMFHIAYDPIGVCGIRFAFRSPFIKIRDYLDPNDFVWKRGPTHICRMFIFRRSPAWNNKLKLLDTGPITAQAK